MKTLKKGFGIPKRFAFGIGRCLFFHKNIGIGGEFSFTSFPLNNDNLVLPDPDIVTISDGHYITPMGVRYFNIGPYLSLPLPHNWFITGKIGAGNSTGATGNVMVIVKEEYQEIFGINEFPYLQYKAETAFS